MSINCHLMAKCTVNGTAICDYVCHLRAEGKSVANTKNNLGAQRTRATIERVFLDMAAQMPVRKITVAQIVRRCEISRGTFYLHFNDVYDLAEKVGESMLNELETELEKHLDDIKLRRDGFPFLQVLASYIESHQERARFAFSSNVAPSTRERMVALMERFCADALLDDFSGVPQESRAVLGAYVSSGIFGLIEKWVAGGCKEDAEAIVKLAGTLIVSGSSGVKKVSK